MHRGPPRAQALDRCGALRVLVHVPQAQDRLRDARGHGLVGDAPQHEMAGRGHTCRGRLVRVVQGGQQVDGDEVGEFRDRHVRQLLRRPHHIEGGADAPAGLGDQLEPLACPVLLRDVARGVADAAQFAHLVPQRRQNGRPGVLAPLTGGAQKVLPVLRLAGLQHTHQALCQLISVRAVPDLVEVQSAHVVLGEAQDLFRFVVDTPQQETGVVQRLRTGRELGEAPAHEGVVGRPGLLRGQGGHQEPLAGTALRCPVVREDLDLQPPAVTVPDGELPVPSRQLREGSQVLLRDRLSQQIGR